MEKSNRKPRQQASNRQRRKRGAASKQEVRNLERLNGLGKTRQMLVNIGRSSGVPFLKAPQGPKAGANFSVREMASTFNSQTGLSNVGSAVPGQLIVNSPTGTFFAIGFRADDLGNIASYGALFDQYRVDKIRVHFRSRNPATFMANTASPNAAVPSGYIVVDRDDITAPTSVGQLQQYDNVIAITGPDSAYVDLIPSITSAAFTSGVFSGYTVRDSDALWCDMANTDIISYGIKGGVSSLTASTTSSWTWDIFAEYFLSFRKTR